MSTFARKFSIKKINEQVLKENPWFSDMLRDWRPAGDARHRDMTEAHKRVSRDPMKEEDPQRLRLAIRNGYLNIYRGGQSVAKVDFDESGGLRAHIHNKFVYGDKGSGQAYVVVTSAGFIDQDKSQVRKYGERGGLRGWVSYATKHTGKEKRFVDEVVARNPNTIDLEMALPASVGAKQRVAPRMDLVAIEPFGDRWRIVFWEAKLVRDPRLRCRGKDVSPEVVGQLKDYTAWLAHPGHRELVVDAYQNTCRLLVAFRELAWKVNPHIEKLGQGIVSVASASTRVLDIDCMPRLIIDERKESVSFRENGHLKKLLDHGLHVQMVKGYAEMAFETRG
jgi:hypothetical protein